APEPFEDKRRTEMVQTVNEPAQSLGENKKEDEVQSKEKTDLAENRELEKDIVISENKEASNKDTPEVKTESVIAADATAEPVEAPVTKENRDIFDISFDDDNDDAKVVDFRANKNVSITKEAKMEAVTGTPEDTKTTGTDAAPSAEDTGSDTERPGNEKKMQYIPKQQVLPNLIPEDPYQNAQQMELLPKERVISEKARKQYRLIGSIFNTYWMFSYQDKLYFVDQHAAHEKVNYEKLVRQYKAHQVYTQQLNPPIIVSLSPSETETLEAYQEHLAELGFTIESFGGTEYAISTIPLDLYRKEPKTLFMEILNELSLKGVRQTPNIIDRVLATMACKASVKGGDVISMQEMDAVLDELLSLENPYHCPHGRPTIFSMSRTELERKFKRIVN
ncbi:MAG: hypothetical protein K6B69_10515, partial [Lachnospiraceae bacterium]|nr:hypothetical protein [Lachnospiraceae bacterium]